ncbi:MAG: CAP domain-containing protein [Akkermansiaceae bacterium]
MKTYPTSKVILVACVGALASCAPKPETQRLPVSASLRPDSSLSEQVLREVNSYRRSHGASQLQRHAGLDRLAREHSEYLRKNRGTFGLYGKNVSHIGFDGRALAARTNYQMENLSENVAAASDAGPNNAKNLLRVWRDSKAHDSNMRSTWNYTGIGIIIDSDGTIFATQLFASMPNSQVGSLRERFNRF